MSRRDRKAWEAQLATDPKLRAAWDGFRQSLANAAGQMIAGDDPDVESVRRAVENVMAEAGAGEACH